MLSLLQVIADPIITCSFLVIMVANDVFDVIVVVVTTDDDYY